MVCALREWTHAGVKNGSGEDADPPNGSTHHRPWEGHPPAWPKIESNCKHAAMSPSRRLQKHAKPFATGQSSPSRQGSTKPTSKKFQNFTHACEVRQLRHRPALRDCDLHRDAFVATDEKSRAPEQRLTIASRYTLSEHRALELCWNLRSIDRAIEGTLHASIRRAEGHLKTGTDRLHKYRRVV